MSFAQKLRARKEQKSKTVFAEKLRKRKEHSLHLTDPEATTGPFITKEEQEIFEAQRPEETLTQMFTGELRETPETEAAQEFFKTEPVQSLIPEAGIGAQAKITAGLMLSFDPKDQIDIIKNALPDAQISQDNKGNTFIEYQGQKSVLNKPGFSAQDAVASFGNFLNFLPIGKVAALGKTVLQKLAIGFATGATAEQLRQEAVIGAGSEQPRQPAQTAIAGVMGGVTEAVGPIRQAMKQRAVRRGMEQAGEGVQDVAGSVTQAREAVEGLEQATGTKVGLMKAQQTMVPSELKMQRFLPQLEATSQKTLTKLRQQNKEVADVVDNLIENIAPRDISGAPEAIRTAAREAIDAKKAIRSEISSPLFNAVKKETVDVAPVLSMIDNELKPFLGQSNIKTQLKKIRSNITPDEGTTPTMGQLMKAKAVIDDVLNTIGEGAVKGDSKRLVQKVKEELLTVMDGVGTATKQEIKQIRNQLKSLTPDIPLNQDVPEEIIETLPLFARSRLRFAQNTQEKVRSKVKDLVGKAARGEEVAEELIAELPTYGQARVRFAQKSPEVAALTEGLVGRVSKLSDEQIETVADKVLNPRLRPQTIKDTKKIIESVSPEAWNDILAFKLTDNISKIKPSLPDGVENVAGKLRNTIFGNDRQKKVLLAGMTNEQRKNFQYLDTVLSRASSGRAPGSPTAGFQEMLEKVRSVPLMLQKFLTFRVGDLQRIGEGSLMDRRWRAIASVMLDDQWVDQMTEIRRMNLGTATAGKAMLQILREADATLSKGENNNGQ